MFKNILLAATAAFFVVGSNASSCQCVDAYHMFVCFDPPMNNLHETLLTASDCPNAKTVNLRHNMITSLDFPKEFVQKHCNASFFLSGNRLTSLDWMIGWTGPVLSFHNNNVSYVDPKLLGQHLVDLFANKNALMYLDLSNATRLNRLWTHDNRLEEIIYPNPCSLGYIGLPGNKFKDVSDDILRCDQLIEIDFSRNLLNEFPKSVVRLLSLRPARLLRDTIVANFKDNNIRSEDVSAVFKEYQEEEHKITIHSLPDCACANVQREDKKFVAVEFCISSMCRNDNSSNWENLLSQ